MGPKVNCHVDEGQIREQNIVRWAHSNIKLLHFARQALTLPLSQYSNLVISAISVIFIQSFSLSLCK